jgi:bacteriocin biosynthesis cyclodehydratase domain-containing protein
VLVAVGEPAREATDAWMRDGVPHLVLRLTEGHAVVGPFVRPAETACLRCIDAHHTDVDPSWPLLVAQYATAVTREREDTVPEPVDTVLATLAAAWAACEIVSHAEGREPATTSATIRLDPHLTALETQAWPRHPACGCSWA